MNQDILQAHRFSSWNREQLQASSECACFYCLEHYPPSEICAWTDGEQTAVCPNCQVDAVLGNASGVNLDGEFLKRMHAYWFD